MIITKKWKTIFIKSVLKFNLLIPIVNLKFILLEVWANNEVEGIQIGKK